MRAGPIGYDEFASLLAPLGPFEPSPCLAVAVSGGPDSMALAVLAHDWAVRQGGRAVALIVDHGLRPEAAKEARAAARRLERAGLGARVLTWRGEKAASGLQAQARDARYDLLHAAMLKLGSFHLLVGHHAEDQAETFLLRLGRGSGPAGLAGMAPIVERPDYRLLRPVLAIPKARLKATLAARGLTWVEDPSNADPRFARVRLRGMLPGLAAAGLALPAFARAMAGLAAERDDREAACAALLAGTARLDPRGWVSLAREGVTGAGGKHLLEHLILSIGGARYAPRQARAERLWTRLSAPEFAGGTLGGCRVVTQKGKIWVLREVGRCPPAVLIPGRPGFWDGRFRIVLGRRPGPSRGALTARCLGSTGWREVMAGPGRNRATGTDSLQRLPAAARFALASLWDDQGLIAVPHLRWSRPGWSLRALGKWDFQPRIPLSRGTFTVV